MWRRTRHPDEDLVPDAVAPVVDVAVTGEELLLAAVEHLLARRPVEFVIGESAAATLRVSGAGARSLDPFGIEGPAAGESRTFEVPVATDGPPGVVRPVTVIAETPASSATAESVGTV